MARTEKKKQLIEFKGTTMPVVTVSLRSLQAEALAAAAQALFGDDQFFDGDAALLELSQLDDITQADWSPVKAVFAAHGLHVVGVPFDRRALGVDVRAHPVETDKQWSSVWWLTPSGWTLAIPELVRSLILSTGSAAGQ